MIVPTAVALIVMAFTFPIAIAFFILLPGKGLGLEVEIVDVPVAPVPPVMLTLLGGSFSSPLRQVPSSTYNHIINALIIILLMS